MKMNCDTDGWLVLNPKCEDNQHIALEADGWNPNFFHTSVAQNSTSAYFGWNYELSAPSYLFNGAYTQIEQGYDNSNNFVDISELQFTSQPSFDQQTSNLVSNEVGEVSSDPAADSYFCLQPVNLHNLDTELKTENPKNDGVQYQIIPSENIAPDNNNNSIDETTKQASEQQFSKTIHKNTKKSHNGKTRESKKSDDFINRTRNKIYATSQHYCEPCGRSFVRKRGLTQHNSVHHSEPRRHRCDQCGKKFHHEENLQKHEKLHKREFKKFKCPLCPKTFAHQSSLTRHKTVSHAIGTQLVCSLCGAKKGRADHLAFHMWTKHGVKKSLLMDKGRLVCRNDDS